MSIKTSPPISGLTPSMPLRRPARSPDAASPATPLPSTGLARMMPKAQASVTMPYTSQKTTAHSNSIKTRSPRIPSPIQAHRAAHIAFSQWPPTIPVTRKRLRKLVIYPLNSMVSIFPCRSPGFIFTVALQKNNVLLEWATTSEKNTKEYIIERALDNKQFIPIGSMPANNQGNQTSNYKYLDVDAMSLASKDIYYRLKQVDQDGKYIYSEIKSLPIKTALLNANVNAYPNPFDRQITLQIKTVRDQQMKQTKSNFIPLMAK